MMGQSLNGDQNNEKQFNLAKSFNYKDGVIVQRCQKCIGKWTKHSNIRSNVNARSIHRAIFKPEKQWILVDKLESKSIWCETLRWVQSFLENTKQYVEIQGTDELSNETRFGNRIIKSAELEVPKGTIIMPDSFLVLSNDPEVHIAENVTVVKHVVDNDFYSREDKMTYIKNA